MAHTPPLWFKALAVIMAVMQALFFVTVLRRRPAMSASARYNQRLSLVSSMFSAALLLTSAFVRDRERLYLLLGLGALLFTTVVLHAFFIRVPPEDE